MVNVNAPCVENCGDIIIIFTRGTPVNIRKKTVGLGEEEETTLLRKKKKKALMLGNRMYHLTTKKPEN